MNDEAFQQLAEAAQMLKAAATQQATASQALGPAFSQQGQAASAASQAARTMLMGQPAGLGPAFSPGGSMGAANAAAQLLRPQMPMPAPGFWPASASRLPLAPGAPGGPQPFQAPAPFMPNSPPSGFYPSSAAGKGGDDARIAQELAAARSLEAAKAEADEKAKANKAWTAAVDKSANAFAAGVMGAAGSLQGRVNSVAGSFGVDKASPNTMHTLNARFDVAMAQMGSALVGLFEGISNRLDQLNKSGALKAAGYVLDTGVKAGLLYASTWGGMKAGAAVGTMFGGPGIGTAVGGIVGGVAGWLGMGLGTDPTEEARKRGRSNKGLPGTSLTTGTANYDSTFAAALSMGANSPETDLLKQQLDNLDKIHGVLGELKFAVESNGPAFRP